MFEACSYRGKLLSEYKVAKTAFKYQTRAKTYKQQLNLFFKRLYYVYNTTFYNSILNVYKLAATSFQLMAVYGMH